MTFEVHGPYADPEAELEAEHEYERAHGLGEIVSALIGQGLTIHSLCEYSFQEWQASFLEERDDGRRHMPRSAAGDVLHPRYEVTGGRLKGPRRACPRTPDRS